MTNKKILTIPTDNTGGANKKTKFVVGGAVIVFAIVYLIYTGIQSTSAYFLTIDELYGQEIAMVDKQVRVSGMVNATTIDYNNKDLILQFKIAGETGQELPVVFNGPMPDQMREGAEAIVEGKFDGDTFQAKTLLLKCPSRYEGGEVEEIQVEAIQ